MFKRKKADRISKGIGDSKFIESGKMLSFLYHLPNFVRLYWSLFWDKRAPKFPKIFLILSILYFLSPIDLIPDLALPGLGYVDDLAILAVAIRYFIKLMPKELVAEKIAEIDGKVEQ
ncbi:DUF1232 domain-containing protein [bacterium]|nr:DUF1232 domain-containing protein [bacterium]